MPRPKSAPDPYLLGKVSALYYLRHHTQQEIAERLRVSRPTVSRLLQEARDLGYVQITVASPRGLHLDLETSLEDQFKLQTVHIVEGGLAIELGAGGIKSEALRSASRGYSPNAG